MLFQQKLRLFFECQEVARTCPDTKKMVPHPFEKGEKVPARYLLGTIKMLHFSFEAETGVKCSLECFRKNIPFYVVRPKPNDWGMCLCMHCINPEIKREALANLTKDTSFHWEDGKSYKDMDGLVERTKATNTDKTIMYNEWQSVEQERTSSTKTCSRQTKVNKKVTVHKKVSTLKKKFIEELLVLKDHFVMFILNTMLLRRLTRTDMLPLSNQIGTKTGNLHNVVWKKDHITTKTM